MPGYSKKDVIVSIRGNFCQITWGENGIYEFKFLDKYKIPEEDKVVNGVLTMLFEEKEIADEEEVIFIDVN